MSGKILITGMANTGKTTLLKTLKDVLVVAHDGKKYPFPQPHVNVDTFKSVQELIEITNTKAAAYKEKFGELPKTIAYDSVSKIFETIADNCNEKYTGFNIYTNLNKEIHLFTSYIENVLIANGINVILVSHVTWDAETAAYQLAGSGSFAKRGGFLAEVDYASFVELKNGKRIVHHKSAKFPARSLLEAIPESQSVEEFSLQDYVNKLTDLKDAVADFEL